MNIPPSKSRRKLNMPPSSPPVTVPDDLTLEFLSLLPVKSLMRLRCVCRSWNALIYKPIFIALSYLRVKSLVQLRCVCKSWNALISNPTFIKNHLKKSAQNPHIVLISVTDNFPSYFVVDSLPVSRLVENPLINLADDHHCGIKEENGIRVVGSCNGLLCLSSTQLISLIYVWNPATRQMSTKSGCYNFTWRTTEFAFGYDISRDTYKVVAFFQDSRDVQVCSLGEDTWRNIQCFPKVCLPPHFRFDSGVYLSGTLNWLVVRNNNVNRDGSKLKVEHYVIISLDLGTETYTKLLPPRDFDEVSLVESTICVLMDSLCFTHDSKGISLVIWKMVEFGVQKSWTQFFKICYHNLEIYDIHYRVVPLCLYGDTLILVDYLDGRPILYNWKNNKGMRTTITASKWWFYVNNYVESLVSTDGK